MARNVASDGMSSDSDPSTNLVDGNKNETEIPIGDAPDAEARGAAVWRCKGCGEMGDLGDALPEACPECAAPREDLSYWEED